MSQRHQQAQSVYICSKLTTKTQERGWWRLSGVFIVSFEHISQLVLVFLLLSLNIQLSAGQCQLMSFWYLYCWLWVQLNDISNDITVDFEHGTERQSSRGVPKCTFKSSPKFTWKYMLESLFNKLAAWSLTTSLKRGHDTGVFLRILRNF